MRTVEKGTFYSGDLRTFCSGLDTPVAAEYHRTYLYAWWIMANNLISPQGQVVYEAMTPSKINYVGLWLWDSAMHMLAYRHVDPELARNQIRAMLACQLPDGMIPDAVYDEGVVAEIDHPIRAEVTKPPILAWAALKLHEIDPDLSFLEEIYVPLVRWNAWWFSMNDDDVDGLVQYNRMVNYRPGLTELTGHSWTQAIGRILVGATFLHWGLEFRQYSFNPIGRVLQNLLGRASHTLFRFSEMLGSPRPFRGAFRALAMANSETLLLTLTNESFLWKRCLFPLHGAHKEIAG